jgi:nicotinamidase-related amidase
MLEPPILNAILDCSERDQIILFGALTEVCVRKTCFDLLTLSERPFKVSIVTDAVISI